MTPELALGLGAPSRSSRAAARGTRPVLIGKDTRLSATCWKPRSRPGDLDGGRVLLCGPVPTPAVAHLTVSMRADAGIVISASHNPYDDNGHQDLRRGRLQAPRRGGDGDRGPHPRAVAPRRAHIGPAIGRAVKLEDARGRYVAFVKSTFPRDLTLDGLRWWSTPPTARPTWWPPRLLRARGPGPRHRGAPERTNINREVGALHPDHARPRW